MMVKKGVKYLRDIASMFWREGSPRLLRMASCCAPGAPMMLNKSGVRSASGRPRARRVTLMCSALQELLRCGCGHLKREG